jgi:nucleotidyltransferase/DNA polymerase involved in DNA repair
MNPCKQRMKETALPPRDRTHAGQTSVGNRFDCSDTALPSAFENFWLMSQESKNGVKAGASKPVVKDQSSDELYVRGNRAKKRSLSCGLLATCLIVRAHRRLPGDERDTSRLIMSRIRIRVCRLSLHGDPLLLRRLVTGREIFLRRRCHAAFGVGIDTSAALRGVAVRLGAGRITRRQ